VVDATHIYVGGGGAFFTVRRDLTSALGSRAHNIWGGREGDAGHAYMHGMRSGWVVFGWRGSPRDWAG
jgi:hypothetical protein